MDTGKGEFTKITPQVANQVRADTMDHGVFTVGEVLLIRGSRFRIQSIGRKKMKLKLLKR